MAGKRINLSDLADEPPLAEARVPAFVDANPRTVRVDHLALNPLNTRDVSTDPSRIESIAASMRTHGQLQPCAVVSRSAFLRIFPEHGETIGDATYVQVTGARRRAAAIQAEMATLEVTIKNELADTRAGFVSATAAENLDRENYDPIEEARQIALLVTECGSQKDAAAQLSRTPAWVTQRLNLLKLAPEVQAALRAREIPLREVRVLHGKEFEEQIKALASWRADGGEQLTAVNPTGEDADEADAATTPQQRTGSQRPSPAAAAIRRLGGTPPKIAQSLRAELDPEDLRQLVELLSAPSESVNTT